MQLERQHLRSEASRNERGEASDDPTGAPGRESTCSKALGVHRETHGFWLEREVPADQRQVDASSSALLDPSLQSRFDLIVIEPGYIELSEPHSAEHTLGAAFARDE